MRDRLEELRRLSQQTANGKQPSNNDVEKGTVMERSGLLDSFFSEVDNLREELNDLKTDIENVQKIHSFLLNAKEPDKEVVRQRTCQLDDLNSRIRKMSIAVKNKLKQLRETNEALEIEINDRSNNKGNKITGTDLRIRETQVSFLQKWFMDIMTDHSTSQADYNDRHKKLLRAHMEVIGINKTDEEFDKMMREDSFQDDLFTEGLLRKTADAKQALAEVNARHDIIIQIEKSLVEVHDLFVQMANMVEQQGDMINVIERNVVRASEAARSGQTQLKEAKEKQSSARRKKIICYTVLVLLGLFVFGGVLYDLVIG
jgi:t-SNARE complex subunit (syntaxin)